MHLQQDLFYLDSKNTNGINVVQENNKGKSSIFSKRKSESKEDSKGKPSYCHFLSENFYLRI